MATEQSGDAQPLVHLPTRRGATPVVVRTIQRARHERGETRISGPMPSRLQEPKVRQADPSVIATNPLQPWLGQVFRYLDAGIPFENLPVEQQSDFNIITAPFSASVRAALRRGPANMTTTERANYVAQFQHEAEHILGPGHPQAGGTGLA